MPPKLTPSFENTPNEPIPSGRRTPEWTPAMQERFDAALKKQTTPVSPAHTEPTQDPLLNAEMKPVQVPLTSDAIVIGPSKYGDNVVGVTRTTSTNITHKLKPTPESTSDEDGGETIFQPLESPKKPEVKVTSTRRPSMSMTNRLIGVSKFLKKLGVGIRDTVFPGLDSDVEIEHSILRGKDGMPELEYKRIYSILTSPTSKVSNDRRAGFLAQIEGLREKQIAKENSHDQTEPTFAETPLPTHTPNNEATPQIEPYLEDVLNHPVTSNEAIAEALTTEHIDIFSATSSPEPIAPVVPINLPILTEIVHSVPTSDETSQEVPFVDPLHVAYMKAQKERETQQQPSVEKAPTTLKGKFTKTANRLKGFFSIGKKGTSELSDDDIDDHYMDHETALTEIDSLYASATSHMDRGTARNQKVEALLSEKATSPEQHARWEKKFEKLRNIQKKTNTLFKETLENVGPKGKKLVTLLTAGSEYINTQVNNKAVRTFAAAGLITAGALAAYATPVVLASMAGVGFGLRIVSAAKLYTTARNVLDTKYKEWEKEGKKVHRLKVAGLEIGAVGAAIFAGDIIGKIFEGIASLDIVREVATSIKNTANIDSVTEAWSKLFTGETPVSVPAVEHPVTVTPSAAPTSTLDTAVASTQQAASNTLESVVSDPSLIHTVAKGDSLWSLLRADLDRLDFEGFKGLNQGDQEKMIQKFVDKIDVPSGSKDLIRIKETLDFNKYFKS